MLRFVRRFLILVCAIHLGCGKSPAAPGAYALSNATLGVPGSPPSLIGVVAAVQQDGRVVLERRGSPAECERAAIVSLSASTRIVRRSGVAASATDVIAGQPVSAWFGDVELRSCPVQVGAMAIVLEPSGS